MIHQLNLGIIYSLNKNMLRLRIKGTNVIFGQTNKTDGISQNRDGTAACFKKFNHTTLFHHL